jgi:hypothetical protein
VPLLRWVNTSTFHSLHHTRLRGNYWADAAGPGTLGSAQITDYEAQFLARGRTALAEPEA